MREPMVFPEHHARLFMKFAAATAVFSALMTIFTMSNGLFGANAWSLIDVAILLGLAYGVFRGNVTCALLLFAFHVVNRAYLYFRFGFVPGSSAIMYGIFYLAGAAGAASLPQTKATSPVKPIEQSGGRSE